MPQEKSPALAYLDLFFPIHYLAGIQVEDAMKCGVLSRQQICILWTIRTQGENGESMRRKEIERAMASWYEVTSSAISKSLRALTKPPLDYLTMVEDPDNGREKIVRLTPKGRDFLKEMIKNGEAVMAQFVEGLEDHEIQPGITFLTRAAEIFQAMSSLPAK